MRKISSTHKKLHDDYLLESNQIMVSQHNEPTFKNKHHRKLSLLSIPVTDHGQILFPNKNKSLNKNQKKGSKKSTTKPKEITGYDVHTIQTVRTEETVQKKPRKRLYSKTNSKRGKEKGYRENKRQKNKEKIAFDSLKNKKPLKLSKSGRFQSEYHVNTIQPLENYTQNTVYEHQYDEQKQMGAYSKGSIGYKPSLDNMYTKYVSFLASYQKKLISLSQENSKLRTENKRLKEAKR